VVLVETCSMPLIQLDPPRSLNPIVAAQNFEYKMSSASADPLLPFFRSDE